MQSNDPQQVNVDWSLVAMAATLIGSVAFLLAHLL